MQNCQKLTSRNFTFMRFSTSCIVMYGMLKIHTVFMRQALNSHICMNKNSHRKCCLWYFLNAVYLEILLGKSLHQYSPVRDYLLYTVGRFLIAWFNDCIFKQVRPNCEGALVGDAWGCSQLREIQDSRLEPKAAAILSDFLFYKILMQRISGGSRGGAQGPGPPPPPPPPQQWASHPAEMTCWPC